MYRNKDKTKINVPIPAYITPRDKGEIALRIIDFIRERTREGFNVYGRRWSPVNPKQAGAYTKEYAEIKGYSSPVDLEDTGDMLDAITFFVNRKKGEVTIGYKQGTKQERKAEGNILGSYGSAPNPRKSRPFLDILKKDVDKICQDYIKEVEEEGADG